MRATPARLLLVSPSKLTGLDSTPLTEVGILLETFTTGELRKQASWWDEPVTVGPWRTHDGDEVEFVMEFDDGRVLAFEVKANERVTSRDSKGVRTLRGGLGDRCIAGVAFNTGADSYEDEHRIHVSELVGSGCWARSSQGGTILS